MRLTTLALIAFSLNISATVYSQKTKLSLDVNNQSIKEILYLIENQSEFRFIYESGKINLDKKVSVREKDQSVETILNRLFAKEGIKYEITENNLILINPAEKSNNLEKLVAQQQKNLVTGIVTDTKGEPIIGANVVEKGTTNGTVTDLEGRFSLNVASDDATLIISYIGYVENELSAKGKSSLNIVLREDNQALDEVVVVGYGTQKKINLTGAVASVKGEEIVKRPVMNASNMLQGLMAGVQVTQPTGQPGSNTSIQIRGMGTFSDAGSSPLVLIDGVEGDMNKLDPNVIESVSVLKDAASASIYGSRAANGVILVKTKDGGTKDGKVEVSYNFNMGFHSPTKMLDLVTNSADYMEAFNTFRINNNYGVAVPDAMYPQEEIEKYRNATDRNLYPNYDWVGNFIKTAPTQMHSLSVSGGDKTRYNLSLGYFNEEGTMEAFGYKRYNGQLNVVSDVSSKLKIGGNIVFSRGDQKQEISGATNYFLCVTSQAPTYRPTLADGSGRYTWRAYDFEMCNWNPYYKQKEETTVTNEYNFSGQAWADLEIIDGLHWNVKGATRYQANKSKGFSAKNIYMLLYRDDAVKGYQNTSYMDRKDEETFYTNIHTYLDYAKTFGKHDIGAMVGYSNENNKYSWLSARRQNFSSPQTPEINAGSPSGQTNGGTSEEWSMQSVFGRVNYAFDSRYLFEANLRYDGTSRMASGNRWGVFPSFSAGWRISEEAFMESSKSWLNNLKIRASWGKLGNQNIGIYPYQAMLEFTGNYPFDDANLQQGVAQKALNNKNIKWETTTTTNIGIDATVFNRLSLTFEVYKKLTENILRKAQVNSLVGMTAPIINDGSMKNVGFDLDLRWQDRIENGAMKGFTYGVGLTLGSFKNKVVKFGAWEDGGNVMREEGRPWNTFYLLQADGIFQSAEEIAAAPKQFGENTQPGMLRYKDVNNDGVINNDDRVPMEDGVFPKCTYGFNLNAEYKGFDLYAFFQGVAGSKVYVTGWGVQPFQQGTAPTKDQLANAWTPENHSNTHVMLGDPCSYSHPSTYLLQDNSYFRLKTLQVGYTLPKEWISKIGLSKVRFYLSGDNLFTFTDYEGLDPERSGSGTFLAYPQNKVLSFGCNIVY
ncbi:TonB-dependent receptor [Parabacteroides sp.]|uniref:TonB-dependent receptor n=1 Tax=Parabacteroides sp. TaxID=1869337 RepID=UPI003080E931